MNWTEEINRLTAKLYRNCLAYGDDLPHPVGSPEGQYRSNGKGHWTDGFWPGLILLGYAHSKDEVMLAEYEKYIPFLEERVKNDPGYLQATGYIGLDHDVGFQFHLTAVHHYLLTGSEASRAVGLKAAEVLLGRFRRTEYSTYIRAWNDWDTDTPEFRREKEGKAIVDSLINIPLLFWAAHETGVAEYRQAAEAHAGQLEQSIIRSDGSTYHTFNFDPDTGRPLGGRTAQGYDHESTWSRGHSWAIYGFALAFRYTGNIVFRQAALRCLEYWNRSLLAQGDAPWDFAAPRDEYLPIDTSAMSIVCCGLLELHRQAPEEGEWLAQAKQLAERLLTAHRAPDLPHAHAFLLHGSVGPAYRKDSREEALREYSNANQCVIYGDYFLYEALLRLQEGDKALLPWDFPAGNDREATGASSL
ncbi:MAG: glucuronyl hydrolase [Paenibacillaceae bacterium]|nr:glucuronyl hydrolase [Paenibacillaceae bacterium]